MDAEKNKKLQQYAVALNEQAIQEEKNGKTEDAAKRYLKLVDVFLVLAAEAQDHNTWQQMVHQAENYQSKARSLISKDQRSDSNQGIGKEISPLQKTDTMPRVNPLKKMLKPFQRTGDVAVLVPDPKPPISIPHAVNEQKPMRTVETIPPEVYQRVVSENRLLRDRVSSLTKETEEKISALEKENGELQKRISEMVPRADYEVLQSEFTNVVPKSEYDRVTAQFLNMVPKQYFDELLNKISQMVPKQDYLDAERRVLQLEEAVRNTVPKKVIDDLANEISEIGMLSEVPLQEEPDLENEEPDETASSATELLT